MDADVEKSEKQKTHHSCLALIWRAKKCPDALVTGTKQGVMTRANATIAEIPLGQEAQTR